MVALFVLLTFVLFIVVDYFVLKAQKKTHPAFAAENERSNMLVFSRESVAPPLGLLLSKGHTWVQKNEYGLLKVGVDDFIMKALGALKIQSVAAENSVIKKGDAIMEGMIGDKKVSFRSPVTGTVKLINQKIVNNNITDPYGDDWGLLIVPKDFQTDLTSLMSESNAVKWMKEEFRKLKDFIAQHSLKPELVGSTMYDGGNVVEGVVSSLTEDSIQDFEKEFLTL